MALILAPNKGLSCPLFPQLAPRQFLDVVHQAVQPPLRAHLVLNVQREPVQSIVVPDVAKHRLYRVVAAAAQGTRPGAQVLMSNVEITVFKSTQFFADGNIVVVLLGLEFSVRSTGKRVVEPDEVHIWRFNDQGEVQRFRHWVDTWQSAMALKGD